MINNDVLKFCWCHYNLEAYFQEYLSMENVVNNFLKWIYIPYL